MELVAGKEWLLFQAGSGPKILTSLLLKVNMEIFTAWHVPREELQPVASCMLSQCGQGRKHISTCSCISCSHPTVSHLHI